MKYLLAFTFIACGAHALDTIDTDTGDTVSSVSKEKFTGESEQNLAKNSKAASSKPPILRQTIPLESEEPIPAIILPNNVCVINTDLSPTRSIEDHIVACIRAHKVRQSIAQ